MLKFTDLNRVEITIIWKLIGRTAYVDRSGIIFSRKSMTVQVFTDLGAGGGNKIKCEMRNFKYTTLYNVNYLK